jgi:mannose-6-phosphate isomerase-like protein (cupin superfamily)
MEKRKQELRECGPHSQRIYYILSGKMKVKTGDQEFILNEGDSVYRPSNEPGEYSNCGKTPCVCLIIVVPKG